METIRDFKVIVTLGPSIWREHILSKILELGPVIFRINCSHMNIEQITQMMDLIHGLETDALLMVDLPGNKIRTSPSFKKVQFSKGDRITFCRGDTNHPGFIETLLSGDILFTNDSLNSLRVSSVDIQKYQVHCEALNKGILIKNKGIHVRRQSGEIPFLLPKDKEIIRLINKKKCEYLNLSFVRSAEDIQQAKAMVTCSEVQLVAKVELQEAISNLDGILDEVGHILIDRGDLSNAVGVINVPLHQGNIIRAAHARGKKVFLATQFLKYMENHPIPLIAEVEGLYHAISQDVEGIQLSEETAIGEHALECIHMIFQIAQLVRSTKERAPLRIPCSVNEA